MTENNIDALKIDASPTKDFFISILVRDIKLVDAITDLVDNCVDGARRMQPDGNYKDLYIHIDLNSDHFIITDNCGGIPAKTARDYAFRFGRPKEAENTPHSIGQFGVGMKRALFKMGEKFIIESVAQDSKFKLDIDVNQWKGASNKDEHGREIWEFQFTEVEENLNNAREKLGTIITVSPLHQNISDEFGLEKFVIRLISAIENAHQQSIENDLDIEVNSIKLKYRLSSLLCSNKIKPLYKKQEIKIDNFDVNIRIYAGISDANLSDAGWYVFCNERLILSADKTQDTGWNQQNDNVKTPKSHYQFSRFRGYVYFDCDNASLLPWNTTKNGIDLESPLYQSVKLEMINAMRPVIDFLNDLDNEMDTESTILKSAVESAQAEKLSNLSCSEAFGFPRSDDIDVVKPKDVRISYTVPTEQIEIAKELLNVKSNPEVGKKTFSYFLKSMGRD